MIEVTEIQAAMKAADVGVWDRFTAQRIADALPFGAMALRTSERDVLDIILRNHANDAIDRLLAAHRRYEQENEYG